MKKSLFIAVAALALVSCGGGSSSSEQEKAKQNEPLELAEKFQSADLAMQELQGKVKKMEFYTYTCDENGHNAEAEAPDYEHISLYFFFDEKGVMTKGYTYDETNVGPKLIRNAQGQIERYEHYFSDVKYMFVDKFTYNASGTIATEEVNGYESTSKTVFTYDEDNNLISSKAEQSGEGSVIVSETTYKILEKDDHGNWTRRLNTNRFKEAADDGKGTFSDTVTEYLLEVRNIVYY